ncbi:MAG: sodium:solute symporter family protein [Saprospiraceae bacterium]|nr:sodium:solute symporter family protein [Saprospiraceae bacterium]
MLHRLLSNSWFASILLLVLLVAIGLLTDLFNQGDVFWPGYLTMMFFYVVIFFIALRFSQRFIEDHILAGRSLPLWLGVFTMSATWIGGGFINGSAEYTYSEGILWVQAPWGYALSLIVGGLVFAGPMRSRNYTTMLDPLEERFGRRANLLFFLPAVLGDLFWTSAILVALGTTFGTILGLGLSTSIILSGLIVILYTSWGGLWSVAITDVIQLLILFAGLVLVVQLALGGWDNLAQVIDAYGASFGARALPWPTEGVLGSSTALWWDSALLLIFGGIPWQVYFQRVLASKSPVIARRLSLLAGLVCLMAAIPPIFIGMIAYTTDTAALGLPPLEDPAFALPYVIKYLTNPWVATVGLGAIAAAVMSSADSSILSSSTVIVWNVLPVKAATGKNASVQIRRVIWIVGVCTICIALQVGSIYQLWFLCSDLVYCLLFPLLVTALFDKRANQYGAFSGFAVALFLRLGGGEPFLGLPAFLPYPAEDGLITVPFKTIAMLTGLLTIVTISRIVPLRGMQPAV